MPSTLPHTQRVERSPSQNAPVPLQLVVDKGHVHVTDFLQLVLRVLWVLRFVGFPGFTPPPICTTPPELLMLSDPEGTWA